MAEKLDLYEFISGSWGIAWYDDGDPGLIIGQAGTENDPESAAAFEAIKKSMKFNIGPGGALVFKDFAALKALRIAKAAADQVRSGKVWPDWAIMAKAAGWSEPEGWEP